jgi:hypothetical protein
MQSKCSCECHEVMEGTGDNFLAFLKLAADGGGDDDDA